MDVFVTRTTQIYSIIIWCRHTAYILHRHIRLRSDLLFVCYNSAYTNTRTSHIEIICRIHLCHSHLRAYIIINFKNRRRTRSIVVCVLNNFEISKVYLFLTHQTPSCIHTTKKKKRTKKQKTVKWEPRWFCLHTGFSQLHRSVVVFFVRLLLRHPIFSTKIKFARLTFDCRLVNVNVYEHGGGCADAKANENKIVRRIELLSPSSTRIAGA